MKKTIIALSLIASMNAFSIEIDNKEDYLVKKGDTLWDISSYFLKNPWEWKNLWKNNPQIKNPHLIYPDDLISLSFNEKGEPVLSIEKNAVKKAINLNENKEIIIQSDLNNSLPSINSKQIKLFDKNYSINKKNIEKNIVDGSLLNKKGDEIIVYMPNGKIGDIYTTVKKIRDLDSEKALYRNTGKVKIKKKTGDLYIADVIDNFEAISLNDVIVKTNDFSEDTLFYPTKPKIKSANIIDTLGVVNATKNDIVLIDKGILSGVEIGNMFSVVVAGKTYTVNGKKVSSGDSKKGTILIYKIEDNFSMGIIVENKDIIKSADSIVSPF